MKTTCNSFISILSILDRESIKTKDALMLNPKLYECFVFAAEDFIRYTLCSKTSGVNGKGESKPGNTYRVKVLEELGISIEDIVSTCKLRIIEKLDFILRQPFEKQKNYTYRLCNNVIVDLCRDNSPKAFKTVSLQGLVRNMKTSHDEVYTLEDLVADYTYNPEHIYMEQETISELITVLIEKKSKEQAEKRELILNEISVLSEKPAEILCRMACTHLNLKPRKLAKMLIEHGIEYTYANILLEVSRKNNIKVEELHTLISHKKLTVDEIKANSQNIEVVSAQISRLKYRAGKDLIR